MLLHLLMHIIDDLKYFALHLVKKYIGADAVLTALAIHSSLDIDWEKSAVLNGYVSYTFRNSELFSQ